MSDLRALVSEIIQRARLDGAVASEAVAEHRKERRAEHGKKRVSHDESVEVTIRVYDAQGRRGQARGKVAESTGADAVYRRAFRALERAEPDEHEGPAPRLDILSRGLSVLDRRQERIEDPDRLDVISDNVDQCLGTGGSVRVGSFTYVEDRTLRVFASSRGFDAVEECSGYRLEGSAHSAEAPDAMVTGAVQSRHFADVASVPLGHELGERVLAMRTRAEMPTERCPIILEPRVVATLIDALVGAMRGERLDTKRSFMMGREGETIGPSSLHLIDDAGLAGANATRAFDDRGVPPMPMPLIKEGVIDRFYEGPARAHAHGRRPSGHERADGSLWPGNLVLRPGSRSRNMLFPLYETLVAVDDILDVGGISERSGRIEVPVRISRWLGSELQGYIGEAVLSTDYMELLGGIEHFSSDQERFGFVDACTVITNGPWFSKHP